MRDRGPDEQPAGRVLQPRPFEIPLPVIHRGRTCHPERRASGMAHDRLRRVPAAEPEEPRAIREVHVLVDHEEALIESAQRLEHGAPYEKCAAARTEHLPGRQGIACRPAISVLERTARAEVAVARTVHRRGIVQKHEAGRGKRELRPRRQGAVQPREPVRLGHGVVVEEHEHRAARRARAGIVACRKSEIRTGLNEMQRFKGALGRRGSHPLDVRANGLGRSVGRSVVHDNHLESRRPKLRRQRIEARPKPAAPVVVEDDHGDEVSDAIAHASLRGQRGPRPVARPAGPRRSGSPAYGSREQRSTFSYQLSAQLSARS